MNNKNNRKNKSLILLAIIIAVFLFTIFFINKTIKTYENRISADYAKLSDLEKEKRILFNTKKSTINGSKESLQVKKYIMTDNVKTFLSFINELEDYSKRNGLSTAISPIISVTKRENAAISKFNAEDVVINIKISGDYKNIENFLNLINNLPHISYIEKIDIRYDFINKKNNADIVLVIYQKHEIKQ